MLFLNSILAHLVPLLHPQIKKNTDIIKTTRNIIEGSNKKTYSLFLYSLRKALMNGFDKFCGSAAAASYEIGAQI